MDILLLRKVKKSGKKSGKKKPQNNRAVDIGRSFLLICFQNILDHDLIKYYFVFKGGVTDY